MASISANGSKGHHKFTLELIEGNYDINNNTSPVEFTFKISPLQSGWNWSGWSNKISYKVIIDGAEYTGTIGSYNGSSTVTLKSDTKTVYHEADGSKSIDFSFTVTDTSGQSYTCGNASSSGSMTLTTIPRASSVSSITGGTIGQTLTVNISRASSSFTHDVIITYGSKTQTLGSGVGTSASGTLDMDFCNQIPSSTTAQAILTLITYSGGTSIGRTDQLFTITVPNSVVPSISSVSKSDSANLVGTYGAYVQGKSDLRVVTNASGSYSSWISSYIVNIKDSNNNVLRQLSGNDVTLYDISYTGTLTIEVIVTDSRGRQASNNSTITVAGYNNPKINSFSSERRNNDSTVTLTWSAEITNINNVDVNSKTFKIYKRQKGQSSWGNAIVTYTSAYTYSSNNYTTTCDSDYGWEFLFEATDSFTSTYYQVEVGTAFELINWKADGTAMAIGKVSEKSNTLEVALNTELNEDLHVGKKIYYGQTGRVDYGDAGFEYDYCGNMKHKRSASGDNFGIDSYAGPRTLYFFPETGDTKISGKLETKTTKQYFLPAKTDTNYNEYYLLAKIPASDASNHNLIRISGTIGGWASSRKLMLDFFIANRDGFSVDGEYIGYTAGFGWYSFKVHQQNNDYYVYLWRTEQYTGEVILDIYCENVVYYGETSASSPVGTDVYTINQDTIGNNFHKRTSPSKDLNDYKVMGSYQFDNHGDYSNAASSNGICFVNVYGGGDWIIQEYHRMLWHGSSTDKWVRQYGAGVWSSWQKIV